MYGPDISIASSTSAIAAVTSIGKSMIASATQHTCATEIVQMYTSAAGRRGGSSRAACAHRNTIGTRMTT